MSPRPQRRDRHGEILSEGQRLEEAPLLAFQCEDGQETYGDDQQSEEAGAADFFHSLDHD